MGLRDLLAFFGATGSGMLAMLTVRVVAPRKKPIPIKHIGGVQRLPVKASYVGWRPLKLTEIEPIVAEHDTLYLGCYLQLTTDRVNDFEDGLHLYLMDCLEGKVIA